MDIILPEIVAAGIYNSQIAVKTERLPKTEKQRCLKLKFQ